MGSLSLASAPRGGMPLPWPKPRAAERAWHRLRGAGHCHLTTRTPYGEPDTHTLRARNRVLEAGAPLWFFVEAGSGLLLDVRADPQVRLDFTDDAGRHLVAEGRASIGGRLDEHVFCDEPLAWRMPADELPALHRLVLLRVDVEQLRELAPPAAANDACGAALARA